MYVGIPENQIEKQMGHEMKNIRLFRVWSVGFGAQNVGFGWAWRVGFLDLRMWG